MPNIPTRVYDSAFEIRVKSPNPHVSRVFTLPTGVQSVPRGLALMEHDSVNEATTDKSALLAQPNGVFLGFLVRGVRDETTDAGKLAVLEEQVFPRAEIPQASGGGVSVEEAIEIEAEGPDYLLASGVGAITTSTVEAGASDLGTTHLNFIDGKLRLAQGTERKEFVISKILVAETAGNVRLRARRV